jgi:hypothetical protein
MRRNEVAEPRTLPAMQVNAFHIPKDASGKNPKIYMFSEKCMHSAEFDILMKHGGSLTLVAKSIGLAFEKLDD